MKTAEAPNSAIAGDLAAAAVGRPPIAVRRFDTGLRHYVFEATFDDRAPVVVRIAADHSRSAMAGALELSRLLRPRGVPLPEVIDEGLTHQFSHLVLERLPGTDLGDVIRGLSDSSVEVVAAKVAQAQRITAKTASARRYGYGVDPTDAPPRELVAGLAGQSDQVAETDHCGQTLWARRCRCRNEAGVRGQR